MEKAAVYDDAAAVYVRISADPAGLRAGVERQREDCLAEAARRGWEPEVFEDNDMSAYRGKPRPAYERMLAGIESGEIRAVVVYDPTRLTRHLKELEHLIGVVEAHGVQVVTLKAGDWDLTTPQGRFMARQLGLLARLEAETIADRVQRARVAEAKGGRPNPGGRRPWGFEDDKVSHRPEEVAQIREAALQLLDGASLASVARGVARKPKDVKRALISPRIAGLRAHHGERYPAVWEPVLDTETWEAVRALLSAPERDVVRGRTARSYLLTGFAYCGVCGATCEAKPSRWARRYRCSGPGCVDRSAEGVEDTVRDWVLQRADVQVPRVSVDPQLGAAVAGYRERLDGADRLYLDGQLAPEPYARLRRELEERLQLAEAQLAAAAGAEVWVDVEHLELGRDYAENRAWWDQADLRQRRLLVGRYVAAVTLQPTSVVGRFDRDAVALVPVE